MPPIKIKDLPKQFTSVVVDGSCSNITTISGKNWITTFLPGCSGLTTIDLSGFSGLTAVGADFLFGCTGLTAIDLSPLSGVTTVGWKFLSCCTGLTTIVCGLSGVNKLGDNFLHGCSGLTTIDLSPLSGLTTVGNSFLDGCTGTVLVKDSQTSFTTRLQGTSINVRILTANVLPTMSP